MSAQHRRWRSVLRSGIPPPGVVRGTCKSAEQEPHPAADRYVECVGSGRVEIVESTTCSAATVVVAMLYMRLYHVDSSVDCGVDWLRSRVVRMVRSACSS